MAGFNNRFIVLVIFMCAIVLLFGNNMKVYGQCQGDIQGLMQQCAQYVQKSGPKVSPSQGCCSVLKNVDLACVCSHITDDVEKMISMEKSAFVAQSCGKPLAHGTKCGSKMKQF